MAKLEEWQLRRKDAVDAIRYAVRYHFECEKRRVLNEVESELLAEWDKRHAEGLAFDINPAQALDHLRKALGDGV